MLVAAAAFTFGGPGLSRGARNLTSYVFAPFGEGGMYLATEFEKRAERLGQRGISPGEARRLVDVNRELTGKLAVIEAELTRNLREQATRKKLYGWIPYEQWELIPARVVGVDSLPYGQSRLINAGRSRGVHAGASVTTRRLLTDRSKALPRGLATISGTALVGRVIDSGRHTGTVRLVTDRGFRTTARIIRKLDPNHRRTITVISGAPAERELTEDNNPPVEVEDARGDGKGNLIVGEVRTLENIQVGDSLVSAGEDGLFPANLRIGTVVEVIEDPKQKGLFVSLRIKPDADLDAVREVYIVAPVGLAPQENR